MSLAHRSRRTGSKRRVAVARAARAVALGLTLLLATPLPRAAAQCAM